MIMIIFKLGAIKINIEIIRHVKETIGLKVKSPLRYLKISYLSVKIKK
jgi:hypothetical protein